MTQLINLMKTNQAQTLRACGIAVKNRRVILVNRRSKVSINEPVGEENERSINEENSLLRDYIRRETLGVWRSQTWRFS